MLHMPLLSIYIDIVIYFLKVLLRIAIYVESLNSCDKRTYTYVWPSHTIMGTLTPVEKCRVPWV
jgi:hypothetical protein